MIVKFNLLTLKKHFDPDNIYANVVVIPKFRFMTYKSIAVLISHTIYFLIKVNKNNFFI
jgi:hypothetical protein